jgi:hypothetical protein
MYVVDFRRETGADVTRMTFFLSCLLFVYMEWTNQINQTLAILLLCYGMELFGWSFGVINGSTTTTTTTMMWMIMRHDNHLR